MMRQKQRIADLELLLEESQSENDMLQNMLTQEQSHGDKQGKVLEDLQKRLDDWGTRNDKLREPFEKHKAINL